MATPDKEDDKPTLIQPMDEDVIDLAAETVLFEQTMTEQQPIRMVEGSGLSFRSATASLLQWRLRAILILALLFNLFFLIATTLTDAQFISGGYDNYYMFPLTRIAIFGGLLALLWTYQHFSLVQLRAFEAVIFGTLILLWILHRYFSIVAAAEVSSEAELLSNRFNGLLTLIFTIFVFAMLIPHRWQFTAKAVFSMALAPLVVTAMVHVLHPELTETIRELTTPSHIIGLLLNLLTACFLAVYGAGVLNYMRERMHKAEQYGQYRLVQKIGAGGMGEVHLAEHSLLKRPCALKLIKAVDSHDEMALARFEREVRTTASLTHPHTIEIYDYGNSEDGVFYYVMEFLPGMSLAELIAEEGPLPVARALHLLDQACDALVEAHGAGLIHRDLKPDNLYVSERGGICDFVKVLDFGLVRSVSPDAPQLTNEQVVSGTPRYMAPEQVMGESDLDERCDIYAIGCIAYSMLTGRTPFQEKTGMADMIAHTNQPVTPPSELSADVPADVEAIILKCLEKDRADRFQTMFELREALRQCEAFGEWDSGHAAVWWEEREVDVFT